MIRRLSLALAVSATCILAFAATAEAATTESLALAQGPAFAILGHSCGGIQEKPYATGWNPRTGAPVGDVFLSTRCGGSGRGGGGGTTTYTAWAAVTWRFNGSTLSYSKLSAAPAVNPTLSIHDGHGDQLYNAAVGGVVGGSQVYTQAYLVVLAPATPTGLTATPSAGQWLVAWHNDPTAPPALISSTTITATPVNSAAAVVTTTVTGTASQKLMGPLQPLTTYQITILSNDPGGSSAATAPVVITTGASAVPPAAPTGVSAYWVAPGSVPDNMVVTWKAAAPGDSPTDQYTVLVTNPDTGQTYSQTVSGTTLSATLSLSDVPDYTIKVQAHDAAGWGAWSTSYLLGGV